MKHYVVYDPASGEIISWGICQDGDLAGQGAAVLEGDASPATHYVSGGALVAYTAPEVASKAARPSYNHDWSNTTRTWVDRRTLEQTKSDKRAQIKAARSAAAAADITFDGHTFTADAARILSAAHAALRAQLASTPLIRRWTLADNSRRLMSRDDILGLAAQLEQQIRVAEERQADCFDAIDGASDAAAVALITF